MSKLDFVLRLCVVMAGAAWALAGSVMFVVEIGRSTSLSAALPPLLSSAAFASALWLSGFGACRGRLRWFVLAGFAQPLGRVLLGFAALMGMPGEIDIAVLTFMLFAVPLPIGLAVFLLFRRPPSFLLALERLVSRPSGSAPAS